MPRLRFPTLVATAALAITALTATPGQAQPQQPTAPNLPVITPTPQQQHTQGLPLAVPAKAQIATDGTADPATLKAITESLHAAGATTVTTTPLPTGTPTTFTVAVGAIRNPAVKANLAAAGGTVPADLKASGYSLASRGTLVTLAGNDSDGTFYAAQTLRQLVVAGRFIAAESVVDYPAMPLRGTIEGFYGTPWSQADRLDQMAFYGKLKMNTYIYTPKNDPYLRDRWQDPYPADQLATLKTLAQAATTNHVRFTYALAPGLSMCYSSAADRKKLLDKMQSIYDIGVRSFYLSFDDIHYTTWNCDADQAAYGAPSAGAAGKAQTEILNLVQQQFLDTHPGTEPLQMVPTEYSDTADSPYKTALRTGLDKRVVVQWTGTAVIPPSISVEQAKAADAAWGRPVFIWDNYPVDDYAATTGRLLLAPYAKREAGLSKVLSGIVLNPMNQASASKFALFGGASFTWNDTNYDPERTWRAAAGYLAGGDPATTAALLALADAEHLAPLAHDGAWQEQAPGMARVLATFRAAWATPEPFGRLVAVAGLRSYADLLAAAPAQIRKGTKDPGFLTETKPWLDALALWGQALGRTADGLAARAVGDTGSAATAFAASKALAARAAAIQTIPGTTKPQGPVKVADGVLDTFLAAAPNL